MSSGSSEKSSMFGGAESFKKNGWLFGSGSILEGMSDSWSKVWFGDWERFFPCGNSCKLFHTLDLQDPNSLQELLGKSLVVDFWWWKFIVVGFDDGVGK